MDVQANKEKGKRRLFLASITFAATIGGLLFGYVTAVISGAVKAIEHFFIKGLMEDAAFASSVIFQFRIVVLVIVFGIIGVTYSLFRKLFDKKKALSINVFLGLIAITLGFIWLISPAEASETALSSIKGFTVSSALIGCIIGGVIGDKVSLSLGRRKGLLLAATLFAFSALGSALPDTLNIFGTHDIISFIIYRIIGGVGVGLASMLTPMYIAEVAPAEDRGKLVSWNQFAIIFGMLVVYFVNYYIAKGQSEEWIFSIGWRYMFASELIPAFLFLLFMFLVPETPRFFIMKGQEENANKILNKIYNPIEAKKVLGEIQSSFSIKEKPWLHYGSLVIFVGIFLSIFQQFVGINVVLYYAPEIFRTIGADTDSSLFQTILVGIINLSFTVIAIFSVDRFGRKPLMVIGALGMAVSMISLGFVFYMQNVGLAALIFMLAYTAFFAMSWGPVTWVLLSELFPNSIRGAMSIAVAIQWLANLAVSWTFPMMNDSSVLSNLFHHGFAYWIYGLMAILAALFMWKFVPETKGKSLEEIENCWIN